MTVETTEPQQLGDLLTVDELRDLYFSSKNSFGSLLTQNEITRLVSAYNVQLHTLSDFAARYTTPQTQQSFTAATTAMSNVVQSMLTDCLNKHWIAKQDKLEGALAALTRKHVGENGQITEVPALTSEQIAGLPRNMLGVIDDSSAVGQKAGSAVLVQDMLARVPERARGRAA